jgi:hypothetical protein
MEAITPAAFLDLLVLAGKLIWKHLWLLIVIDVVFILALVPGLIVALGVSPLLGPMILALFIGPVWAGAISLADSIVRKEDVSVFLFLKNIRRHAVTGIKVSILPCLMAMIIIGTLMLLEANSGETWMIVPLVADGSMAILISLASLLVFSLATNLKLRGKALWLTSFGIVASHPIIILGTIILLLSIGLIVFLSGPAILPFLPAPFAVYLSTIARFVLYIRMDRTE